MAVEFDPLSDEEPPQLESSSRESIKSFWIGCTGLALLAHVAIFLTQTMTQSVILWLTEKVFKLAKGPVLWQSRSYLFGVSRESLIPCLVVAAVVPILYWRGGLGQRFSISVILAITTMNLSASHRWHGVSSSEFQGLCAIVGCWLMFPVLFLLTPINTPRLRLIVASCLLILTVCVSVIHMMDLRRSFELMYWESFYGAALIYALIRRNWGRVAILEAAATDEQVERTSSRTLLELMAVCGLGCAAAMYWSESSYTRSALYFVQASVLGIASVVVSMASVRIVLTWKLAKVWVLVPLSLIMWVLITSNSSLIAVYNGRGGVVNWSLWLQSTQFFMIAVGASFASMEFVFFLVCIGTWLRICGWQVHDRSVSEPC